jgi:dethiobiotin synthetase
LGERGISVGVCKPIESGVKDEPIVCIESDAG